MTNAELSKENKRLKRILAGIRANAPDKVELGGYTRVLVSNYALIVISEILNSTPTEEQQGA